jgi:two-component system, chemotaxis family, sensor kinase Cph1
MMKTIPLHLNDRFDLNEYIKEPLHIPGLIQPHGILFVLKKETLEILQVSKNIEVFFNHSAESLIGKQLKDIFSPYHFKKIKQYIKNHKLIHIKPFTIKINNNQHSFNGVFHYDQENQGKLILELEQNFSGNKTKSLVNYGLEQAILNIRRGNDLKEICGNIVKEVKKLTQFDRVLVYKFGFDDAGLVIAEEVNKGYESYLGLHYPHLDIPPQARNFYKKNWLRLIPDVNYQPVAIIPNVCPETEQPLDLTHGILRSVSPCHVEYLKNMEVEASMSISLVNENQLWGLVACHNYSPKYVDYGTRKACEFLGQFLSVEVTVREEKELYQYHQKINVLQRNLKNSILNKPRFLGDLIKSQEDELLSIFNTTGLAVCLGDNITLIGKTPSKNSITKLIKELIIPQQKEVFHTDNLADIYPLGKNFKELASGILAISIFLMTTSYHILWFRPEQNQIVNWAGNPQTIFELNGDGTPKLCPRNSFELWQETVTEKSLPWQSLEIEAARELRHFMLLAALEYSHFSQEMLEQVAQKANAANQAKSQFLAKMSHELRTPLNAILGFTQIMSKDHSLSLKQKEYLDIINRSGEHLLTLINDVLEVSRIEAGQISLNETSFDITCLIDSIKEIFILKASNKGLELIIEQAKDLPRYIYGDQGKLRQIIFNLVGNAIKFTQKGYILMRISSKNIPALDDHIILKLEVEDTGIGIAKEEQESIFDPFKQAHANDQSFQGTGLGLSISRQFARLMNGDIKVKSELDHGSTFTCQIQLCRINQLESHSKNHSKRIIALEGDQNKYRILVVEDVQENQQLMIDILQSVGFSVRSANNGVEAVEIWEKWQPHLIWMDMKMPIMSGYEAVKIIREKEKQKKDFASNFPVIVIALTATAFNEEKESILAVGCNDFVRKPCKEEIIFEKIGQYLGVRYIYEDIENNLALNPSPSKKESICNEENLKKIIKLMPSKWIEDVYNYALGAREKQLLDLIKQIPQEHYILTQCLTEMINNLAFEKIIELIVTTEENS